MSTPPSASIQFRVRYSEIDKMGTFYNSRALEWFEWGRVELMRAKGIAYHEMERRGFCLPLIEAHVEYLGRAAFDDLLTLTTSMAKTGKARVRFDMTITHAAACCAASSATSAVCTVPDPDPKGARLVARGYTIHAITDGAGKPARPPAWLIDALPEGDQV